MTYQRASIGSGSEAEQEPHRERQQFVDDEEKDGRRHDHHHHYRGRNGRLLAGRPSDFRGFLAYLADELHHVGFRHRPLRSWQGQQDSNPRPAVLETAALPAELCPSIQSRIVEAYSMILATTPAPTVLPPSRMAKRRPSSMAIGWISSTCIETLSPGITISVPSGSRTVPVTSVVRK